MSDYYVVVCENDKTVDINGKPFRDERGALVFERYLSSASLSDCREFIEELNGRYGKCKIAKLEFLDGDFKA